MDTQCQPSFRSTGSPRRVVKAVHSGGGKARPPPSCASDGCLTLVGQPLGATLPGPCPRAAASAYVPGAALMTQHGRALSLASAPAGQ